MNLNYSSNMKLIYKFFLISMVIFSVYSCDNFMDIHEEYIKDGEITYSTRMDSVVFVAGKERILFRGWIYNGVNVEKVIIKWNNGLDSVNIPVQLNTEMDSIELILSDMIEKSYTFDIYTVDNFGNRSLTVTDFGASYADTYLSTLIDRRIKDISLTDKTGGIEWFNAPEGLIFNEVRYTQSNGEKVTMRVPDSLYSTVLTPQPLAGSVLEYRSLYIPESESVDTFYTAWVEYPNLFPTTYIYDRSDWEVIEVSDETASDGGGMNTLIDGDLGTYWHSQYGPDIPLPHWAIIDMNSPKKIAKFDVYRRRGNTDSKTVQLFASDDSDPDSADWVKVGEGMFSQGDKLTIESTSTEQKRYLKLFLPDSNNPPFTSIAEIYVYGN